MNIISQGLNVDSIINRHLTVDKIAEWMDRSGISFISQHELGVTVGINKDNGEVEEIEIPRAE